MANTASESRDLTPLRSDLPAVALGTLDPTSAVSAMARSSLGVVLDALRPCRSGRNLTRAA